MTKLKIIFIVLLVLLSIISQGQNTEDNIVLRCLIFPTGITHETYLIKIFENGRFEVTFGNKISNVEKDDFKSTIQSKSKSLEENDFENIKKMISEINNLSEVNKTNTIKGGWEIILVTGKKKNHFYNGKFEDTPLGKLIEKLIIIAPFEIDLHSWS